MTRLFGTLTIGQAPRPDVTPILDAHIPAQLERVHRGLLDGIGRRLQALLHVVNARDLIAEIDARPYLRLNRGHGGIDLRECCLLRRLISRQRGMMAC